MKKFAYYSGLIALSLSATSFAAVPLHPMNKTQLMQALEGKSMTSISKTMINNQLIDNVLTLTFGKEGKIQGQLNNNPSNVPQQDQGTWKIKDDGQVCATWQHWQSGCCTVYKLSNGLLFINKNNFANLMLNENIKSAE